MSTAQTTTQAIALFDTLTDDLSELSQDNKLALFNRKYKKWQNIRNWESMRKTASVAISGGEIVCPDDFKAFIDLEDGDSRPYNHGFYIDNAFYPIARMSERRRFPDMCYFDPVNKKIIIPSTNNISGTADFDYYSTPADLALGDTITAPDARYHDYFAYEMAVEHYSIDQTEAGRTKVEEYQATAEEMVEDMEYEDNQLKESWNNYA